MFNLYIKITAIIIFIAISFKFLTKIITFNTNGYRIANTRKSAILSLLIVVIQLIISTIYLIVTRKYFMNISSNEAFFVQAIFYLLEMTLVLGIVILSKESISSIGIAKKNLLKSVIAGITIGIVYYLLVINVFKVNKVMNIISTESFNTFINFLIVGFVEEVIYRGYLQTRLISWLGTFKGCFSTSVIFAFTHLPHRLIVEGLNFTDASINCTLLIPVSLLYGYIMIKTRNVVANSIFHTFTDWTETVINVIE